MAAESGGSPDPTYSAQEQAIDLSKHNDSLRNLPPLIPINRHILKKRWIAQNQVNDDPVPSDINFANSIKNNFCKKRRADEMVNEAVMNKCTRDEDSRSWDLRLDRSHSVPHLRALPPLLRCKSLSESRIAPAHVPDKLEQEQELQRRKLEHMKIDQLQETSEVPTNDSLSVGYYTQMLQCFQAQEWLKQAQQVKTKERSEEEELLDTEVSTLLQDADELRRRVNRPLTGRHVRHGTGASPATLLSLRRKIQARQQARLPSNIN